MHDMAQKTQQLKVAVCLALFAGSTMAATASADDVWVSGPTRFSAWTNVAEECSGWTPSSEDFDWGKVLRQSKRCKLTDNRYKVTTLKHRYTGEVKDNPPSLETRVRQGNVWRTATGEKDRLLNKAMDPHWSDWKPQPGTVKKCDWSTPMLSSNMDWGTPWLRLMQCHASMTRTRAMNEYWLSGKVVYIPGESLHEQGEGTFYLVDTRRGENDRWLAPVSYQTEWQIQRRENCQPWPSALMNAAKKQDWGQETILSRTCHITKTRQTITERQSLSGKKEVVSRVPEYVSRASSEWRVLRGKQDKVLTGEWVMAKDWHPDPASVQCKPGLPEEKIPYGQLYLSYRECQSDMLRTYHYQAVYRSGAKRVSEVKEDRKHQVFAQTLFAQGRRDQLIEASAQLRNGDWQLTGDSSCDVWSPEARLITLGETFTQTRACHRKKVMTIERMSRWESGERWEVAEKKQGEDLLIESRMESGGRIESAASPLLSLTVPAQGGTATTDKFWVEKQERFNRVRITAFGTDGASISGKVLTLRAPDGRHFDVRLPKKQPHLAFVEISGYAGDGQWSIELTSDSTLKMNIQAIFVADFKLSP